MSRPSRPLLGVTLIIVTVAAAGIGLAQRGPSTNGQMPSQIHSAPPRTPIPPGQGRIVGRVLDRERLTPIANAAVSVELLDPSGPRQGFRPPVASRMLVSDDAGEFVARDLAFGDYVVVATADGYTPARRLGSTIDNGEPVSLLAGQPDAAVTVRHSRVGSIAGVVSDANGAAVAGVPVRILHYVAVSAPLVWQPMPVVTITDASGRYAFTNVPPGDYVVGVLYKSLSIPSAVFDAFWKPASPADAQLRERLADSNSVTPPAPAPQFTSGAPAVDGFRWFVNNAIDLPLRPADVLSDGGRRMTTFAGGADSVATAQIIELEPGEARTNANISVRIGRGVRVSGTLVGEPAQVAHVGMRLLPPTEHDVLQTFGGELASTITDANGNFSFLDVAQGAALLETVISSSAPGVTGPPRRTPILWARARLHIDAGGVTGLRVPLKPLINVRGRFVFEGDSKEPRPPPTVLWLAGSRGGLVHRPRAATGEDFAIEGLLPGRYLFHMTGFGIWRVKSMTAAGKDALYRAVELADGDLNDVVITFTPGFNRITGSVMNKDGVGVENAQVVVFPVDFRAWIDGGRASTAIRSLKSAARGFYSLAAVTDGAYYVAAFDIDTARDWESLSALTAIAQVAKRVQVSGGTIVTQDLVTMPALPGRSSKR